MSRKESNNGITRREFLGITGKLAGMSVVSLGVGGLAYLDVDQNLAPELKQNQPESKDPLQPQFYSRKLLEGRAVLEGVTAFGGLLLGGMLTLATTMFVTTGLVVEGVSLVVKLRKRLERR